MCVRACLCAAADCHTHGCAAGARWTACQAWAQCTAMRGSWRRPRASCARWASGANGLLRSRVHDALHAMIGAQLTRIGAAAAAAALPLCQALKHAEAASDDGLRAGVLTHLGGVLVARDAAAALLLLEEAVAIREDQVGGRRR